VTEDGGSSNQSAGVTVRDDTARLRQLVGNLIDNAIKHSNKGGGIAIALGCADGMARLTITDTGQGIPPEHLPRIFDRFYRADQARSAKRRGAGLGLSICRMIAEAHDGEISVSSKPGEGTIVNVAIPIGARQG